MEHIIFCIMIAYIVKGIGSFLFDRPRPTRTFEEITGRKSR